MMHCNIKEVSIPAYFFLFLTTTEARAKIWCQENMFSLPSRLYPVA